MRLVAEARERLRALLFRTRAEAETEEELRVHLEMETEANRRRGMDLAEARRQALVAFGGVERYREEVRDARGMGWLEVAAKDARYALRGLRGNPLFAATFVLTLGLGIGAAAAMFSITDALLLRPLPYRQPDRLVDVEVVTPQGQPFPYLDRETARAWGAQREVFAGTLSHVRRSLLFTGGGEPRMLTAGGVTPEFEEVLGVRPALGRGFYPEDATPGAAPVVVLDHGFWRTAYGADPGVVGREIELDGRRHRIVGVMPRGFKFPTYAVTELWLPLHSDGTVLGEPTAMAALVGRLSGAAPLAATQARADALAGGLARERPREQGWSIRLRPLSALRGGGPQVRQAVWFLAAAVTLLLLVAAVNAAGLLLVRGWSRARELAVRVALGASRGRVLGQLVTEAALLAVASGVAAALLAWLALRAVRGMIPASITFFTPHAIAVEGRTVAFTFAVAVATGLLAGAVPALRAMRLVTSAGLHLTPHAAHTPLKSRLRRGLIVTEVALSIVLLMGAGLLIHSFARLAAVDPGFRPERLAVLQLSLSEATYPTSEARALFLRRLEQRLEAFPGVEGVAINGGAPPAWGMSFGVRLEAEGRPPPEGGHPGMLPFASVPPDFFAVLGVPVVAGRAFAAEDAGTDHVVVDRGLAGFLWGEEDPVGRRFRIGPESPWLTVVGVVRDLRMIGPDDRQGSFEVLYPLARDQGPVYAPVAIRTRSDPAPLLRSFRAVVHDLDPRQPVESVRPAGELYAASIDMPRFLLMVMAMLAGVALLLAAIGIYGVLASAVVQRRRELGIRIALGAPPGRVSWIVLREGLWMGAAGAAAGTAVALALSRFIRGLLYEVEPTDPATVAGVLAVSLAVVALACFWPAHRATRVDPVEVLKAD